MPALNSPQSIRKAVFVPVLTIVYMLGWKILELLCFSTSILDSRNSLNIIYQLIVLSLNGQTLKKILEMVLAWSNIPISQTSAVLQCFPTGSPFNFVKWQSNFECYMQSLFPSMTVTRKEINEHYKIQTGTSICIIPLSESTLSLILLETAFPTKNTVSVADRLSSISRLRTWRTMSVHIPVSFVCFPERLAVPSCYCSWESLVRGTQ